MKKVENGLKIVIKPIWCFQVYASGKLVLQKCHGLEDLIGVVAGTNPSVICDFSTFLFKKSGRVYLGKFRFGD